MLRRIVGLTAAVAVSAVAGYQLAFKPWRGRWRAGAEDSARPLPGDELVPDAEFNETMAVTIDAPTSSVWPWLLQLGYGRGGWYSYDAIDMRGHSSRGIRPDLQDLQVGQMVPFAPGMGFRVDVLQPERAVVLYGDDQVSGQGRPDLEQVEPEGQPAGFKVAGLLSQANMSAFQVSWAFVLEPLDGGRTRLLERFRTRSTPGPAAAITGPLITVGHFLMTRKQMLGIKERAETSGGATPGAGPGEIGAATAPGPRPAEAVAVAAS